MNGCVIPGTGIAVDFWQVRSNTDIKFFFLTHLHGDHIVGLTSTWRHPIYCSPLTGQLLTERYGLDESLLRPLEVGQSHLVYASQQRHPSLSGSEKHSSSRETCSSFDSAKQGSYQRAQSFGSSAFGCDVDDAGGKSEQGWNGKVPSVLPDGQGADNMLHDSDNSREEDEAKGEAAAGRQACTCTQIHIETMTVTVIDANHCPGAVMFLFEGSFGKILYTGDFRYNPTMFGEDSLLASHIGTVDRLYLDNTYCSPKCIFSTREEALEEMVGIAREHNDCDILLGLRGLGKEELVTAMALALEEWVCVPPKMMSLAANLGLPNVFRTAQPDLRIRVVPFHSVSGKSMREFNKKKRTIAILPTALYVGIDGKPFINQPDVFVVPYSDHSSYPELIEFVSQLKPASVLPVVRGKVRGPFGVDVSDRENMSCFKQFLSKPTPKSTTMYEQNLDSVPDSLPVSSHGCRCTKSAANFDSLFPDFTPWATQNKAMQHHKPKSKSSLKKRKSGSKGITYLPSEEDAEMKGKEISERQRSESAGDTVQIKKATEKESDSGLGQRTAVQSRVSRSGMRTNDRCSEMMCNDVVNESIETTDKTDSDRYCSFSLVHKDHTQNTAADAVETSSKRLKMDSGEDVIVIDDSDECDDREYDEITDQADNDKRYRERIESGVFRCTNTNSSSSFNATTKTAQHTPTHLGPLQSVTVESDGLVSSESNALSESELLTPFSDTSRMGANCSSANSIVTSSSEKFTSKNGNQLGWEKLLTRSVSRVRSVGEQRRQFVKTFGDILSSFPITK